MRTGGGWMRHSQSGRPRPRWTRLSMDGSSRSPRRWSAPGAPRRHGRIWSSSPGRHPLIGTDSRSFRRAPGSPGADALTTSGFPLRAEDPRIAIITPMLWSNVRVAICFIALSSAASAVAAQPRAPDPVAALDAEVARAEQALQRDERQIAESHFRAALYSGWMLTGALALSDGRAQPAREAFAHAASAVVKADEAQQALAIVD